MSGLDRFIAFDKGEFIGRDAALAEAQTRPRVSAWCCSPSMRSDADVTGFEPVWPGARKVGFVTSGAYGHHVKQSLALAYVDRAVAEEPAAAHLGSRGRRTPRGQDSRRTAL